MKILLVIRSLNRGGAERQFVNLAKGLNDQGHDVCVAVFYIGGPLQQELEDAEITIRWIGKRGRWDLLKPLLLFAKVVKLEKPEVVYTWMPLANIVAALTKSFLPGKTRIVWGVRSSNMDLNQYNWLCRVSSEIERRLSRFADLIIANSYEGREYAIRHGFAKFQFKVVSNGIDTDKFCFLSDAGANVRKEWKIRDDQLLIGVVARLDPIKGHPLFLETASMLTKKHDNVRFVCIGDGLGKYKLELHELSKELHLDSQLIWAGNRLDMPGVYNALDIMVSSSNGEGFSNVIAEAMACGVFCVVTDVGDSARIVGQTGAVVPPRNVDALFTKLERFVSNKERYDDKGAIRSAVCRFDPKAFLSQTIKLLEGNYE